MPTAAWATLNVAEGCVKLAVVYAAVRTLGAKLATVPFARQITVAGFGGFPLRPAGVSDSLIDEH